MTPELRTACAKAIHVLTCEGDTLRGADAIYFIYQQLGYPVGVLRYPPLIQVSELGYRVVASNRVWFSKFLFTEEQ